MPRIVVSGRIASAPSLRLSPGQKLIGKETDAAIVFAPGIDGLQLASVYAVRNIRLETTPDKRAIFNDYNVDSLATIALANVMTIGQVQIIARGT